MPTTVARPRRTPTELPWAAACWAFVAAGVVWLTVVAHGCHRADADHEPAVALPLADSESRNP